MEPQQQQVRAHAKYCRLFSHVFIGISASGSGAAAAASVHARKMLYTHVVRMCIETFVRQSGADTAVACAFMYS